MNSNKFILELAPILSIYSKTNEQLFIEAILNSLVDCFGNNFIIGIYPQYHYLSETQSYENIDVETTKICFIFDFKTTAYTLHEFIIKCYDFKEELSDFIKYFTHIGFYSDKYKDMEEYSKVKYKLVVKNGDYIEKKIIDYSNSMIVNF